MLGGDVVPTSSQFPQLYIISHKPQFWFYATCLTLQESVFASFLFKATRTFAEKECEAQKGWVTGPGLLRDHCQGTEEGTQGSSLPASTHT